MFKVNNKDTRTTPLAYMYIYIYIYTYIYIHIYITYIYIYVYVKEPKVLIRGNAVLQIFNMK